MPYSTGMKPVALPPGRARLSTKPAPTGSVMIGNTIGTVRVACSSGLTVAVPLARMTSGASATNSAACLRISAASPAAQRVSIRTLRPIGPAQLRQRLQECRDAGLKFRIVRGCGHEHADAPHPLGLLRARRERPHAAAPPSREMNRAASFDHLVGAGEQRRRHVEAERLAVLRLITSSNLVGCMTGRSAGFRP